MSDKDNTYIFNEKKSMRIVQVHMVDLYQP